METAFTNDEKSSEDESPSEKSTNYSPPTTTKFPVKTEVHIDITNSAPSVLVRQCAVMDAATHVAVHDDTRQVARRSTAAANNNCRRSKKVRTVNVLMIDACASI